MRRQFHYWSVNLMDIPFSDNPVLGHYTGKDPSDTDAVLSALKFDTTWLLELSNNDAASFVGREAELYSILNAMQLVTSRFAKVA
jgi:hypothetical protein